MDSSTIDPDLMTHRLDQLVVELDHLDTVEAMLADLRVTARGRTTDDVLGLGLLTGLTAGDDLPVAVDDLLGLLRARAACEWDGWVPVLGKNRLVEGIVGDGPAVASPAGAALGGLGVLGHKSMSVFSHKPMDMPAIVPEDEPLDPPPAPDALAGYGVRVGLIDTPLDPPAAGSPLTYRAGHGMFVRSLIARQAPAAEILSHPVLDPALGRAEDWAVAQAIVSLARAGAHVINLSMGSYTLTGGPPLIMSRAVERLGPDVLLVAAAGNHGALQGLAGDRTAASACWPAAIPPCVAVGATGHDGRRCEFSPNLRWVRCSALGEGVVGTYLRGDVVLPDGETAHFDGRARWAGTSFSAATVSGAVAARVRPGTVTARQALDELLGESSLVKPFAPAP